MARQTDLDDIDITPEMIEAGKAALQDWYHEDRLLDEGPELIFRAMLAARKPTNAAQQ